MAETLRICYNFFQFYYKLQLLRKILGKTLKVQKKTKIKKFFLREKVFVN